MIEHLINIDTGITLFLNGLNNSFFDTIMVIISGKFTWIPLYLVFMFFAYKKTANIKVFVMFLVSIAVLITMADQSSVQLFKNVFERLRPCHCEQLKATIHIVNGHCGGQFGFVSSHATNTFALAVFLGLFFKNTKVTYLLIFWAVVVAYSRIYLGVHYFGDVLGGAILGSIIAFLVYFIFNKIDNK